MPSPKSTTTLSINNCILFALAITGLLWGLLNATGTEIPGMYDFFSLYQACKQFVSGENFYGFGGGSLPPFVYPPWMVHIFSPLGLIAPTPAATIWFLLNIFTLVLSALTILRTEVWIKRIIGIIAAIIFLPSQGLLIVGQFSLFALLGAALLSTNQTSASKNTFSENFIARSLGIIFLSLKPHLGGLVIGTYAVLALGTPNPKNVLKNLFWATLPLCFLMLVSTILSPTWPGDYVSALRSFASNKVYQECDTCSSIPLSLGSDFHVSPFLIALFLEVLLLLIIRRLNILAKIPPSLLLSVAALLTLATAPYIRNYDYVILLFPMLLGFRLATQWWQFALLALALTAPFAIVIFNFSELNPLLYSSLNYVVLVTYVCITKISRSNLDAPNK